MCLQLFPIVSVALVEDVSRFAPNIQLNYWKRSADIYFRKLTKPHVKIAVYAIQFAQGTQSMHQL